MGVQVNSRTESAPLPLALSLMTPCRHFCFVFSDTPPTGVAIILMEHPNSSLWVQRHFTRRKLVCMLVWEYDWFIFLPMGSWWSHYDDAIMSAMASQIISLVSVQSAVYSRRKSKKTRSASLAFVRGIHRWPANSPHKGPVTRKLFPFDDVIMARGISKRCHSWWRQGKETLYTLFTPFVQAQIKAPRHWLLRGDPPVTGGFPSQRASDAENVSIWWRHHINYILVAKKSKHLFICRLKTPGF